MAAPGPPPSTAAPLPTGTATRSIASAPCADRDSTGTVASAPASAPVIVLPLVTANGPLRVFPLLHGARPVRLNLGEPGGFDITPWADRVQLLDAQYVGTWELPAIGAVTAPTAVLIRPDGYVAWVRDRTQLGLADALTTWFEPPPAA